MFQRLLALDTGASSFLFGPRGTGKSYWLHHIHADALCIDLLESDTYTQLLADPSRLRNLVPPHVNLVVIDEVQRVPDLLHEVHRLIERQGTRFILTGSSARKLRRPSSDLLAGRALLNTMHPLVPEELGEAFDMAKALRVGLLPALYDPKRGGLVAEHYLSSYVQAYLREEVLQEGLTRNLAAFSRFLEAASFSQGNVLNMAEVARECAVGSKVVASYFDILEDLLIGVRLPAFTRRARRRVVQHPKFYFFDCGVYRTIRPRGPLDTPEETDGAALETLVFQVIRATVDALRLPFSLYFWRTVSGAEVDFVLYGEGGLIAIEVKRKRTLGGNDLAGLKSFKDEYPMARCVVLANTARREAIGPIEVIPIGDALAHLREILVPVQ
ncbi:MAG: DUF4143 domain-containing protein [Lentisphaeria bacterium]|nr:DUF4143 domain-containing protein [Lentisphaeria bacterium]